MANNFHRGSAIFFFMHKLHTRAEITAWIKQQQESRWHCGHGLQCVCRRVFVSVRVCQNFVSLCRWMEWCFVVFIFLKINNHYKITIVKTLNERKNKVGAPLNRLSMLRLVYGGWAHLWSCVMETGIVLWKWNGNCFPFSLQDKGDTLGVSFLGDGLLFWKPVIRYELFYEPVALLYDFRGLVRGEYNC